MACSLYPLRNQGKVKTFKFKLLHNRQQFCYFHLVYFIHHSKSENVFNFFVASVVEFVFSIATHNSTSHHVPASPNRLWFLVEVYWSFAFFIYISHNVITFQQCIWWCTFTGSWFGKQFGAFLSMPPTTNRRVLEKSSALIRCINTGGKTDAVRVFFYEGVWCRWCCSAAAGALVGSGG